MVVDCCLMVVVVEWSYSCVGGRSRIDLSSTSHRPLIDLSSISHRFLIDFFDLFDFFDIDKKRRATMDFLANLKMSEYENGDHIREDSESSDGTDTWIVSSNTTVVNTELYVHCLETVVSNLAASHGCKLPNRRESSCEVSIVACIKKAIVDFADRLRGDDDDSLRRGMAELFCTLLNRRHMRQHVFLSPHHGRELLSFVRDVMGGFQHVDVSCISYCKNNYVDMLDWWCEPRMLVLLAEADVQLWGKKIEVVSDPFRPDQATELVDMTAQIFRCVVKCVPVEQLSTSMITSCGDQIIRMMIDDGFDDDLNTNPHIDAILQAYFTQAANDTM